MGLEGVRGDLCFGLLSFGLKEGIWLASKLVLTLKSGVGEEAFEELPHKLLNGVVNIENKDLV